LQAGRILGFLGPNGAGKTTALRILTTMLDPDSGRFVVAGISSAYPEQIRRKIGALPENLGLPKHLTGIEYLTYFGELYGRTTADARAYGMTLLEEVGMQQRARSLIGSYSHGMRQRLGIARALVNDPVIVFLDEPTLGLDPRGQLDLLTLVRRIARERNAGVVLCSHLLSEIEGVCDDVVILNLGQVVAAGPVAEVIGHVRHDAVASSVRIRVPMASAAAAQQVLEGGPNGMKVTPSGDVVGWLRVEPADSNGAAPADEHFNNRILEALIGAEIPILSVETEGSRLQDVFLHLTEEAVT
jgi:ABC-2 type transport system ATP-binding protein